MGTPRTRNLPRIFHRIKKHNNVLDIQFKIQNQEYNLIEISKQYTIVMYFHFAIYNFPFADRCVSSWSALYIELSFSR